MAHLIIFKVPHSRGLELHEWLDGMAPDWRFWNPWETKIHDREWHDKVRAQNAKWFQNLDEQHRREGLGMEFHYNVVVWDARAAMAAKLAWDVDVSELPT